MAQYEDLPGWMAEVFGYSPRKEYIPRQRYMAKTPVQPPTRRAPARRAPMSAPVIPPPRPQIGPFDTTVAPEIAPTTPLAVPTPPAIPEEPQPQIPGMLRTMQEMMPESQRGWKRNPNYIPPPRERTASDIVSSIVDYLGSNTLPQVGSDLMEMLHNIRNANISRREAREIAGPPGPIRHMSNYMPPLGQPSDIPDLMRPPMQSSNELPTLGQEAGSTQNLIPNILRVLREGDFNRYVPGAR